MPFDVLIARTPTTVIVLGAMRAYSSGLSAHLYLHFRDEGPGNPFHNLVGRRMNRPGDEIGADDVLVLGVECGDGRTGRSDVQDGEVRVAFGGGHGGAGYYDANVWITPLPADDPLTVLCRWPARGVDARVPVDAGALAEATRAAQPLWSD